MVLGTLCFSDSSISLMRSVDYLMISTDLAQRGPLVKGLGKF